MKKILFACLLGAACAAPAHAQGPYVGLGVNLFENLQDSGHPDASLKIFGGYDFNDTWGIETGFLRVPRYHVYNTDTSSFTSAKAFTAYQAGKATMAINDKWSLITKLGISQTRVSYDSGTDSRSDTRVGLYAGIGVKYAVTKNLALTMELERLGRASSSLGAGRKPESISFNISRSF